MKFYRNAVESDLPGTDHSNLRWVLLSNSKSVDDYLAIALLGPETATLSTRRGLVVINYENSQGEGYRPISHSILLVREWREAPDEFHRWWKRWVVLNTDEGYQVNSPGGRIYLIEHKKQQAKGVRLG